MAFTLDSMSIYGQDTRLLDSIYTSPDPPLVDPTSAPNPKSNPSIPTSRCLLLELPLELRQQIYSYALPSTTSVLSKENSIVWHRGSTALLGTCRLLHEECATELYGGNTFALSVVWDCATFDYQWRSPLRLLPRRHMAFPEAFSSRNVALMRRIHVRVQHIDSYTGKRVP